MSMGNVLSLSVEQGHLGAGSHASTERFLLFFFADQIRLPGIVCRLFLFCEKSVCLGWVIVFLGCLVGGLPDYWVVGWLFFGVGGLFKPATQQPNNQKTTQDSNQANKDIKNRKDNKDKKDKSTTHNPINTARRNARSD